MSTATSRTEVNAFLKGWVVCFSELGRCHPPIVKSEYWPLRPSAEEAAATAVPLSHLLPPRLFWFHLHHTFPGVTLITVCLAKWLCGETTL